MARVGAPVEFIRRLPAPLQLATTNWLLAEHDDSSSATLRLRGDEVAAVVSGRYAPMDPVELLDCVRASLVRFGLLDDVRVRGVASGLVDNLRLVLPSEEVALKVGDTSNVGLDISTSSFGLSADSTSAPWSRRWYARTGSAPPSDAGSCPSVTWETPRGSALRSGKPSRAPLLTPAGSCRSGNALSTSW